MLSLSVLQINVGRGREAHDLAVATGMQRKADILLLSEPNKSKIRNSRWIRDNRLNVALIFLNRKLEIKGVISGEGYVCVDMGGYSVVGCYISPNISLQNYKAEVEEIMNVVNNTNHEVILAGDFNAKSPMWGAPRADAKGNYWTEHFSANDMVILNDGKTPTFVRGASKSFIDVTVATKQIAKNVTNWEVLDIDSHTEHRYISFEVGKRRTANLNKSGNSKVDWEAFRSSVELRMECTEKEENASYKTYTEIIREAYKDSIETSNVPARGNPYWWNEEIKGKREECNKIRRQKIRLACKKNTDRDKIESLAVLLKNQRKELRKLIRKSKAEHWKKICEELQNDIWGGGYKIVSKNLKQYVPCQLHPEVKEKS